MGKTEETVRSFSPTCVVEFMGGIECLDKEMEIMHETS